MEMTKGTLRDGEPHPQGVDAFAYVKRRLFEMYPREIFLLRESMASCSIEGNRTAEVCGETLDRILSGQVVSDRYVLGLAWFMRLMDEERILQRERDRIEDVFKKHVPPHALSLEDGVWLKRLLNKAFQHEG